MPVVSATIDVAPSTGRRATGVAVSPTLPSAFQPVTTGADGKFAFKDLPLGTYSIIGTANGFVRQEYGQRSPNGIGRPLFVTAGKTINDATLQMTPTGTVSGRVFDENGQPAIGSLVQILRAAYNVQGRTFQVMGTGTVDDRGDFRIFGVTPGRYYLVAGTPPGPVRPAGGDGARGAIGAARYSMVYYPLAAAIQQASTIEVKGGAETSYNMRVQIQTETYKVRGRIVDGTGAGIPANTNVLLAYRNLNGGASFSNSNRRNFDPTTNTFELQNVSPGDYYVQVQIQTAQAARARGNFPIDATPSAQAPIHVVDADIDGVVLNVTTGITLNGRIVVEGQPISSVPDVQQMSLAFNPTESLPIGGGNPAGTFAAADGTFQVRGLREGEYRVSPRTLGLLSSFGFYIKSIQYGGDDILAKPFKVSGTVPATFEVILKRGGGQIGGNVTDTRLEPVTGIRVFAIPAQRERLFDYNYAFTDQNGHYTLNSVTPGDYQIFSWESIDNGAYFDPEFLNQYESRGKLVHVGESSSQIVDAKLIPAP